MKRILFQGDSITDMGRSRDRDLDLQKVADTNMGYGYATLVASTLLYENPGEYEFFNRGISGNRSVDLYARIKRDIINIRPDIMSILVGVNDVLHDNPEQNGVDAEKYYKIYSMLIEEVKEALPDIKIMILEPFVLRCPPCMKDWTYFGGETEKRAQKAKMIAEKYDLTFIPLQEKFHEASKIVGPQYWSADGVHPSGAGHELIKREWLNAFKTL